MSDLYFKDESSKLIYCLVECDGKDRNRKLNVSIKHYTNKKVATKWRDDILKLINPETCKHPNAERAVEILNEIYVIMTDY